MYPHYHGQSIISGHHFLITILEVNYCKIDELLNFKSFLKTSDSRCLQIIMDFNGLGEIQKSLKKCVQ